MVRVHIHLFVLWECPCAVSLSMMRDLIPCFCFGCLFLRCPFLALLFWMFGTLLQVWCVSLAAKSRDCSEPRQSFEVDVQLVLGCPSGANSLR